MSWAFRCMKCRGRNVFRRHVDQFIRRKTCRHCGHKRFYLDKARQYRKDICRCEGYHYPHRIGTTYCVHNPHYEINVRTGRYGEALEDVLYDIELRNVPF